MEPKSRNHKSAKTNMSLGGACVLIVEVDALLLMELESILQDAGAEIVACCRNVRDGLAALEQKPLAAAILDVRIGQETIAPLARQLASRGTPFLFYTGQVESDPALAEWLDHAVLSKPARPAAIVAAVSHLLEHSCAEQSAYSDLSFGDAFCSACRQASQSFIAATGMSR
jgi:DNA-binding response OmpR family regulator